jgi:hypothetical protein
MSVVRPCRSISNPGSIPVPPSSLLKMTWYAAPSKYISSGTSLRPSRGIRIGASARINGSTLNP